MLLLLGFWLFILYANIIFQFFWLSWCFDSKRWALCFSPQWRRPSSLFVASQTVSLLLYHQCHRHRTTKPPPITSIITQLFTIPYHHHHHYQSRPPIIPVMRRVIISMLQVLTSLETLEMRLDWFVNKISLRNISKDVDFGWNLSSDPFFFLYSLYPIPISFLLFFTLIFYSCFLQ